MVGQWSSCRDNNRIKKCELILHGKLYSHICPNKSTTHITERFFPQLLLVLCLLFQVPGGLNPGIPASHGP